MLDVPYLLRQSTPFDEISRVERRITMVPDEETELELTIALLRLP